MKNKGVLEICKIFLYQPYQLKIVYKETKNSVNLDRWHMPETTRRSL